MDASSIPGRWKYDVFLSFRGEDIRRSFMDHLFKDFKQKGIHAFRDYEELRKGEEISSELYKAIEQSRFLIVIFSKNYAYSSWCLTELVKILECKKMGEAKHEVHTIFYDVKPDVVRKQTESYAHAFAKHEIFNRTKVAKWKETLSKAAGLCGWDLQDLANGYEANFIDSISKFLLEKLCDGPLHVGENIVGVDAHLKKLDLLRFVRTDKVHMIGISGISGIGKTTLAKAIYNLMYSYFEGSCFCDDVQGVSKQDGLTGVQMQLIHEIVRTRDVKISSVGQGITVIKKMMSSKRILLVLDDVDHHKQLEALAGSPDWFSPGSLIIFTSKDKQLLNSHRVHGIYDMEFLDENESLKLFSSYAFHEKHLTRGFEEKARKVMKYVQGHPLALKVFGCFLYGKCLGEWDSELDRLKLYPNDEIQQVLRFTYDGLNFLQQRILLDIAFSFIGMKRDLVASILDSCGFCAVTNLRVLVDKSLVTISPYDMSLQMHGLIQSMAREIVREESNMPWNRSRLWGSSEEIYDILSENKITEAVELIDLWKKKSSQNFDISSSAFTRMKNLRILKLPKDPNVNFFGRLGSLSSNLRYLCWHGCPFKFLPSDFYPKNVVVIDLSYSHIKNLWVTPKCFTRLKILKLSHCYNLTNTPDFTEITNLEELILEGCVNLVKVHPSIGLLKRLVVLNLENCKRLKSFPCKLEMDSLRVLNLSGCFKLGHVLEAFGGMKTILKLHIDRNAITRLASFAFSLTNSIGISSSGEHQIFWSRWWTKFSQPSCLPQSLVLSSLGGLCSLQSLNLSHCNILQVPENIGHLSCLESLNLSQNGFISLPGSLSQLCHLRWLEISGCKKLEVLPELPPSITSLHASDCNILQVPENIGSLSYLESLDLSGNNFTRFEGSLSQLSRLEQLEVRRCKKLEVLPELPHSIILLDASDCNILQMPENIGGLSYLRRLLLSRNNFTSLPRTLSKLSSLWYLEIDGCKELEVFPDLPPRIECVHASGCNILQVPENIGRLSYLRSLLLGGNNFTSLPRSLNKLSRLETLEVRGCKKLKALPELPPSIVLLDAYDCNILQVSENIKGLSNLHRLLGRNNFTS